MARAKIQIGGVDTTTAIVAIGSTVVLSNDDEGGEITYAWSFIDQPEGTPDALSNATIENPTFIPTKEGTYLIRLVVNALLGTQSIQTATVSVLDARTAERIPAAAETTETGLVKGWALATNRMFARAMRTSVDSNLIVASTPGSIAAGAIVKLTGVVTVQGSTQSAFDITSIAAVNATVAVADRLGILIDGVVSGQLGAGKLVLVRMLGLVPFVGTGTPVVGDPVFLSNTGVAALVAGTAPRTIGIVVSVTGSAYRWMFDGVASGGGGGGGGSRQMFDTEFTATSAITFGPSVTPFDPGIDYGDVTFIRMFTDGASRAVNGLKIRNAVHGSVVVLKNILITGTPNYQHLQGGDGQFSNATGSQVNGASNGTVWYRLNANVSPQTWEHIAATGP